MWRPAWDSWEDATIGSPETPPIETITDELCGEKGVGILTSPVNGESVIDLHGPGGLSPQTFTRRVTLRPRAREDRVKCNLLVKDETVLGVARQWQDVEACGGLPSSASQRPRVEYRPRSRVRRRSCNVNVQGTRRRGCPALKTWWLRPRRMRPLGVKASSQSARVSRIGDIYIYVRGVIKLMVFHKDTLSSTS